MRAAVIDERSNESNSICFAALDCFAALAMTVSIAILSQSNLMRFDSAYLPIRTTNK